MTPSITGSNSYTGLGGRYSISDTRGSHNDFNDGQDATSTLLFDGRYNYNPGFGEQSSYQQERNAARSGLIVVAPGCVLLD